MTKKFLLLGMLLMIFLGGCFNNDPVPGHVNLNVPYRPAEHDGYCAIACVQMWGMFDGLSYSQDEISVDVGAWTDLPSIEWGILLYTNSYGWTETASNTNIGQDQCISTSIASVVDRCPNIMPFYGGSHAVLVKGYDYHDEFVGADMIPIADFMYFHDPDPLMGGNLDLTGYRLKEHYFLPYNGGNYAIIVGSSVYSGAGAIGYNLFIESGGTFYGGPANYDPYSYEL